MGFQKFGTGEILPEEEDPQGVQHEQVRKEGAASWTDEDQQGLVQESQQD